MPEGHTIHRIATVHDSRFCGRIVRTSSPQGRFQDGARRLHRRKLIKIDAHGKHLFYFWRDNILHIHLGLYGKFRDIRSPFPDPRETVRIRLTSAERGFDLVGPNRCELISPEGYDAIRNRLGPDPLRADADPEQAWSRISRSRAAIGRLLLDQSVIAGVGNIFRADALFHIAHHPDVPGNQLTRTAFESMWRFLCQTMRLGKKYNRIITADPEQVGKPHSRMNRAERLLVYKKQYCIRCDGEIETWDQGGRTIYACPRCQRRSPVT